MEGVYTTSVNENTLDEAPMAYKSLDDIIDVILSLIHISKEVINIADTLETQTSEIKQINEGIEQINDCLLYTSRCV